MAVSALVIAAGGGWLLPQPQLTPPALAALLQSTGREELLRRAEAAHARRKAEATAQIVAACEALAPQPASPPKEAA